MKAAILLCDEVQEKYIPEFGGYKDMIQSMFARVGEDINFDVFDCRRQEFPPSSKNYDFFITTGSKHSVYEDEDWIRETISYIRQLLDEKCKLIGICFGHQLIAMALGCEVKKSELGWGLGVATNKVFLAPTWMDKRSSVLNIIVSHQDQVQDITEEASLIAGSEFCPYFFVQWLPDVISIQGHPEWVSEYARTRLLDRRGVLTDEQFQLALSSLSVPADNAAFAQWVIAFVKS